MYIVRMCTCVYMYVCVYMCVRGHPQPLSGALPAGLSSAFPQPHWWAHGRGPASWPALSLRRAMTNRGANRGEQSPPGSPQPSECVFKVVNSALNHGVYVAINQEVIRFCSIYLVAQVEKKGWPFPLKTQASSLWLVLRLGPQSTRQPWKAHSLRVQVQWQHPANAPGMGMKRALGERGLSSSYWNPH